MESLTDQLGNIVAKAAEVAETKVEIWKYKTAAKVSSALSSFIVMIVLFALAAISIFILSIGAAIFIGNSLGNTAYGFFILTGFYMIVGFLFYLRRKHWIREPLSRFIANKIID